MDSWLCLVFAAFLVGVGLKAVGDRHAQLPTLRSLADDWDDDEEGWEANGWLAILIGLVEVSLGLAWLVVTLRS